MSDVEKLLEPDAEELLRAGHVVANAVSLTPAIYSIAISLKRIADGIEMQNKRTEDWLNNKR